VKFALVDLQLPDRKANREHTGGFGSFMQADGVFGGIISRLKSSLINLPVLSFAYTAAMLRERGHESCVYRNAPLADADIIIIASSMHSHAHEVAFARDQKQLFPKARVGFYGPFAQTKPEFFEQDADFIIGGELESAIEAFLAGEHEFSGTIDFGTVRNLARLPMPDWEGFPVAEFSYFPMLHRRPFLPMQSTRGCSFNCDFCPYMVSQTKLFRRRDPIDVVDEMERNVRLYGMRSFLFRDICFTLNKKHSAAIASEMLHRGLDLEWGCETRLDCLTPELIDLMVKAGLRGINLGIESVSNDILNGVGKKNPEIEHQEAIIGILKQRGIRVNAFYMLGLPGDTAESMQRTIDYACRLNTQGAQFCVTTPFPGTPLYETQKDQLITTDFREFTEYRPVVDIGTATPKEVSLAHARAYRQFYLRWDWIRRYALSTTLRLIANAVPASCQPPAAPPVGRVENLSGSRHAES
jgi:radical SAM superfamily enzyme YgiQ (UPF0313 family)